MALRVFLRTRLRVGLVAVALASVAPVLTAPLGAGVVPPSPFTSLDGLRGVTFSNDRYAVSLHWPVASYELLVPGLSRHRGDGTWQGEPGDRSRAELRLGCRADNGRPGYGVAAASAVLEVPRHPGMRGTYPLLHPMFWILGLTGNGVGRTPLRVSLTGLSAPFDAVLENSRVYDLGGRLPMRVAGLPAGHVLSLLAESSALDLRAEGPGTVISARFERVADLPLAARAMLAHCPPA